MDTGRLGLVRKRSDYQRKYMFMMNECIRARWEMYDVFLNHERQDATYKRQCELSGVRQSVVKQRVLQKCLKMRRDGVKESDLPLEYGEYGGLPVNALAKDRDKYIAFMHPKLRRLRKVQRNLQQSLDTGAIINSATINRKKRRLFREETIKSMNTDHKNKYLDKDEEFQCSFPDITPRGKNLVKVPDITPRYNGNKQVVKFQTKGLHSQPTSRSEALSNFSTPRSKPSTNNTPWTDTSQLTSRSESRHMKSKSTNKGRPSGLVLPPIIAKKSFIKR